MKVSAIIFTMNSQSTSALPDGNPPYYPFYLISLPLLLYTVLESMLPFRKFYAAVHHYNFILKTAYLGLYWGICDLNDIVFTNPCPRELPVPRRGVAMAEMVPYLPTSFTPSPTFCYTVLHIVPPSPATKWVVVPYPNSPGTLHDTPILLSSLTCPFHLNIIFFTHSTSLVPFIRKLSYWYSTSSGFLLLMQFFTFSTACTLPFLLL